MVKEYDVVVIGSGIAGLTVATSAARLGFKVALAEKNKVGGNSLQCRIPLQVWLKAAKVMHQANKGERWGVSCQAKVDLSKLHKSVINAQELISTTKIGLIKKLGIDLYQEHARFVDSHQVLVGEEIMYGKFIVISTGSSPIKIPLEDEERVGYLTPEEVFSLKRLPKSVAIIGAGATGCELAQCFARFGSQVTLLQNEERILSHEDPEISGILTEILKSEGVKVITNVSSQKLRRRGAHEKILIVEHEGKQKGVMCEEVVVAAGRTPNVHALDLDQAGVRFSEKGIATNLCLQTSTRHIYACGDVRGGVQLSHAAGYEGSLVIENTLFHLGKKADYSQLPWVVFTDPEVACVGLTQAQAVQQKLEHQVIKKEYGYLDRAVCEQETDGILKIIVNKKGYVMGVHGIGPNAAEIIHEVALAIKSRIKLKDISRTIQAYPTFGQIIKDAAEEYYQQDLYSQRTKRFLHWINRFF